MKIKTILVLVVVMFAGTSVASPVSTDTDPLNNSEQKMQLVASIPPIHMMLQDLVGDLFDVEMISQSGSPHHKVMRPSDVAKLDAADRIFWVGPELEQYLVKFVSRYPQKSLSMVDSASEDSIESADDAHQHHDHDHHSVIDPHLWLNPQAVKDFAKATINALSDLDADNSEVYQARLVQFLTTLDSAIPEWRQQVVQLSDKPYFVYHDAYGYLESVLGIKSIAVLTVNPGVKPSAKKLGQLARQLRGIDAACVFYEPEFQQVRLDRVTDAKLEYALIDPLGAQHKVIASGNRHYVDFISRLVDGFKDCLSRLP